MIPEKLATNNFNVIRLLAALQVMTHHTLSRLEINNDKNILIEIINLFPGVPIFFFISGFLISRSYENSTKITDYTINRLLRIYPALVFCTLIFFVIIFFTSFGGLYKENLYQVMLWLVGHTTFFQFYNPEFLSNFGYGQLNPSLWSITVELQLYVFLPILYLIRSERNIFLVIWILVFSIIRFDYTNIGFAEEWFATNIAPIYGATFLPWAFMFLVGVIFQKNFEFFLGILGGKFILIFLSYLTSSFLTSRFTQIEFGNNISITFFILLACLIFSAAFSRPTLSKNTIGSTDLSYGIYIYHFPLLNLMMFGGLLDGLATAFVLWAITLFAALVSWFFIEKKALSLKRNSCRNTKAR